MSREESFGWRREAAAHRWRTPARAAMFHVKHPAVRVDTPRTCTRGSHTQPDRGEHPTTAALHEPGGRTRLAPRRSRAPVTLTGAGGVGICPVTTGRDPPGEGEGVCVSTRVHVKHPAPRPHPDETTQPPLHPTPRSPPCPHRAATVAARSCHTHDNSRCLPTGGSARPSTSHQLLRHGVHNVTKSPGVFSTRRGSKEVDRHGWRASRASSVHPEISGVVAVCLPKRRATVLRTTPYHFARRHTSVAAPHSALSLRPAFPRAARGRRGVEHITRGRTHSP
ncbi:hypothetical protein SRABI128_00370 [Microbacterium sp. Bi128]|nr:hypothetical protein SRABI128_00370 [Microbacterium sp. Bi128]